MPWILNRTVNAKNLRYKAFNASSLHGLAGAFILGFWIFSTTAYATLLNLKQYDFDLDGTSHTLTEWSSVDVRYAGSSSVQYFNLNYNDQWVIQNLPVLSREGLVSQVQQFSFNNGLQTRGINLEGTSPTSLNYTLTSSLGIMPSALSTTLTFESDIEIFKTGTKPETTSLLAAPAELIGATAPVTMKAAHKNFPNQEAGDNECAVAAISNSLMFLKSKSPSIWAGKKVDIETMKTATKWESDGVWIFADDTRTGTSKKAFWQDKDDYMQANKYPVMTTTTTNFADILTAIKSMKDVELELKGHTVSLVGIADLGGGKYSLDVAHDTKQNMAGGTKVETLTWDGSSLSGAKWLKGFNYAVVEMTIPEPSTWTTLLLSAIFLTISRAKRVKANSSYTQ